MLAQGHARPWPPAASQTLLRAGRRSDDLVHSQDLALPKLPCVSRGPRPRASSVTLCSRLSVAKDERTHKRRKHILPQKSVHHVTPGKETPRGGSRTPPEDSGRTHACALDVELVLAQAHAHAPPPDRLRSPQSTYHARRPITLSHRADPARSLHRAQLFNQTRFVRLYRARRGAPSGVAISRGGHSSHTPLNSRRCGRATRAPRASTRSAQVTRAASRARAHTPAYPPPRPGPADPCTQRPRARSDPP